MDGVRKFHILVVDDEEGIRRMLETKLFHVGYMVSTAATGRHALQKIQSIGSELDLIICDLKMPGMGGLELYKQAKVSAPNIPFMLITGYPEKDKIVEAIKSGVKEVLLKPVKHSDLLEKISNHLKDGIPDPSSQAA